MGWQSFRTNCESYTSIRTTMKVLVISQHIFPIQTPRAHRTTELIKELACKGHDVTVYAVLGKYDYTSFEKEYSIKVKNIPLRFQKHPYNSDGDGKRMFIDKLFGRLFRKTLEFPNIEFMLRTPEILKKEKGFDTLITIADPHQIHWGAAKQRKKNPKDFPKVWIADCGDPFMTNGTNKKHYKYFTRFEKLFSEYCDFIVVPVKEAVNGYYEEYRSKIRIIPQGFQFTLTNNPKNPTNEKITFAYAGTFYKDIRNPHKLLDYLSTLSVDFKFIIYTMHSELIHPYKQVLGDKLEIRHPLNREELIEELKQMDFLINIENVNSPTQIPSKLIDYAIAERPILSINPVKPNIQIIEQFFDLDFSSQFRVNNIENYHISNVTDEFLKLITEKLNNETNLHHS